MSTNKLTDSNIIKAIINLVKNPVTDIELFYKSKNRANSMGQALEEYVKDLFSNTLNIDDEQTRNKIIDNVFSYLGNQNNPPDIILKNGDAIEVKKIESKGSSLALNSSYPKHKLYSDSSMITEACRLCEDWDEKDIIYTIGVVNKNKLSQLVMVYGMDYAADADIYIRIKDAIKDGITTIPDIEFSETRELGRVNRVDPLGITYLRVRGMWGIKNPLKVFNYVYKPCEEKEFNFMAIINNKKYNELKYTEDLEKLSKTIDQLEIKNIEIKDPNNPAKLNKAKLITFSH